jgi:hypothetical protein
VTSSQRAGGVAALLSAAIYVLAFLFYGLFWDLPADADAGRRLSYLTENRVALYCATLVSYVLFGLVLSVLVLAVHDRLKSSTSALARLGTVFGLIWVGLVFAAGMISNVGLMAVTSPSTHDPGQAWAAWTSTTQVVEGLGGGNEIVGGVWVLLLSLSAARSGAFPKALCGFGMFVGVAGILTAIPAEIFTAVFGLSQIVWFVWLGISLLRAR